MVSKLKRIFTETSELKLSIPIFIYRKNFLRCGKIFFKKIFEEMLFLTLLVRQKIRN